MINEVLLGLILAVCIFVSLAGFFTAWCAHGRISDIKAENDLHAKDFAYLVREKFTEIENKLKEKSHG